MPKEEIVADLYPSVYSFRPDYAMKSKTKRWIAAVEERAFYRLMHKGEVDTIKRHTGIVSGLMLDVGCGSGDRLARFARAGFQVRGIEIQKDLAEYVKSHRRFEVDIGTLDSVSYPTASFDIVTIYWVIEHLLNVESVLVKAHRILKPGGWLVAEIPLSDSSQSRLLGGRWSQFGEAPRHIGIPTHRGVEKALSASGYTEISILPSSLLNCAGSFALSVVPRAASTHAYGDSSLTSHFARLLGGILTLLYLPIATIENHFVHKPAFGLILARKPLG